MQFTENVKYRILLNRDDLLLVRALMRFSFRHQGVWRLAGGTCLLLMGLTACFAGFQLQTAGMLLFAFALLLMVRGLVPILKGVKVVKKPDAVLQALTERRS